MRAKVAPDLIKIGVHAYLSSGYLNPLSKLNHWESRQKCIISTLVWPTLNEGQNNSKYHKNRCRCLSLKWIPKSTFKIQFRECWKKFLFSTFVWPTLNKGQNSSNSHKHRCPCLSLKWVSKSTLKLRFRESRQKCIFSTMVWPNLEHGPKWIHIS